MILQIIDIGHLHPILVHLPIGILVLAFVMELYYGKKGSGTEHGMITFALGTAALSTLLSVGSGWWLGEDGGYDETLLFRHRWMAVGLAVGSVLLYFIKKYPGQWNRGAYLPLFIGVIGLLGLTGHFGGSMTHGEGYLFNSGAEAEKIVITDVDRAMVYNDIVRPIFNDKCIACHNPNKIKGGLVMTTKEELLKGGDSGGIFRSDGEGPPRLIYHIKLPIGDEGHMPPKGKVQLTDHEIDLLEWWAGHENCFDCVVETLDRTQGIDDILAALEEDTSKRALIAKDVDIVPDSWLAAMNRDRPTVFRLAAGNPLLIVNLSGIQNLGRADFKALKKYAKNIVELNLGSSNFNDTIFSQLEAFGNLTKLQLQNTQVTDRSMGRLGDLKHLESLNIYGTGITDDGLDKLTALPGIKALYPWRSKITKEALDRYSSKYPEVAVSMINSDIFARSTLEPPSIIAEAEFFRDSIKVAMDYFLRDVDIYYTLDGSDPDRTSIKYDTPLILTNSADIRAISYKEGRSPSPVRTASFKRAGILASSVALDREPDERFQAQGGNTLIDLKKGSVNSVDGRWIGYRGRSVTATLGLQKEELVSMVSVGSYSSPQSWIFYPTAFKVWVSRDGNDFQLVHTEKLPEEGPGTDIKIRFFDLNIPPTRTNFVKVEVTGQLKNPSWHPYPGRDSWLLVDEIVLN